MNIDENTRIPPRVRRFVSNQFRGVQIECVAGDVAAQADMQAVVRAVVPVGDGYQSVEEKLEGLRVVARAERS